MPDQREHFVDIGLDQPMRVLGNNPEHCDQCRRAAEQRQRQANCEHPDDRRVEVTALDELPGRRYICNWCGLNWLEDA